MEEWSVDAVEQLGKMARADGEYQLLLSECREAEEAYRSIRHKLTEEEWLKLDDYIALCEELEYRYAQLAYRYGISRGSRMVLETMGIV